MFEPWNQDVVLRMLYSELPQRDLKMKYNIKFLKAQDLLKHSIKRNSIYLIELLNFHNRSLLGNWPTDEIWYIRYYKVYIATQGMIHCNCKL